MASEESRRRGYGRVLRHAVARRLVGASGASSLGDFVGLGALLVVATDRAGGLALGAAGLYAVQAVPGLLAGTVLSGRLASLRPRTALVSAALTGAAALALVICVGGLWPVYVTAALLGATRAVSSPMVSKEVAAQVPSDLRTPLFALLNATFQGGQVPGLLVGGLLAGSGLATIALTLDALTFVVAALVYARLPRRPGAQGAVPTVRRPGTRGLHVILHHPVARSVIPAVWGTLLVGAVPEAVMPSVVDGGAVGIVLAAGPAATMASGLLLGRSDQLDTPRRAFTVAWLVPVGLSAIVVALLVPVEAAQILALTIANAALGVALAWIVGAQGAMARTVRPGDLAQVNATMMASVLVLEGVGALLVGGIADATHPAIAFLAAALVATFAINVGWRRAPSDAAFAESVGAVDRASASV